VSIFLKILAVICGLLLLLPGLCTVYFGGMFAIGSFGPYGNWVLAVIWLIVGGLLCWAGVAILAAVKSSLR